MRAIAKRFHPHLTRDGIAGLADMCAASNHNPLLNIILAIDNRFLGYVKFIRDWEHFESRLAHENIDQVCRDFFTYFGMEIQANQVSAELNNTGKPVILLGVNHEAIIEPLVLASLLGRNDIKFIGMKVFQYLGHNVSEYILPVLPKKVAVDTKISRRSSLCHIFDIIYDLYRLESLSRSEIEELNKASLRKAAEHLSTGGVLIIFPNGGRGANHSWYRGIGQILSYLSPEVLSSVPIVPIASLGLTRKMLFQKARRAAFGRSQTTIVNTRLYDPIYMPARIFGSAPSEVVDYLQRQTKNRMIDQKKIQHQPRMAELLPSS